MLILFTSCLHQENFFEVAWVCFFCFFFPWVCLCSIFPSHPRWSTPPCISVFSAKVVGNAPLLLSCTDTLVNEGFPPWWGEDMWSELHEMFDCNKHGMESCLSWETSNATLETLTNKPLSDVHLSVCFCLYSDPSPTKSNVRQSFWVTDCPLFHFKLKNFIKPDQLWQDGRVGNGRNAAEVITWFRLSWFWFNRGRVCQKISRRSPVPCQIPSPHLCLSVSLPLQL